MQTTDSTKKLYNDPSKPTVNLVTAKEAASLNPAYLFDSQSFNKDPPKGDLSSFGKLVSERAISLLVSGNLNPTQLIDVEVDFMVNIIGEYGNLITKMIYPILMLILEWGKKNDMLISRLGEKPTKFVLVENLFKRKDELPIQWVDKKWFVTKMANAITSVPRVLYNAPRNMVNTLATAPSAMASASKPFFGLFSGSKKMKGGSRDFYILNQLCTILKIAVEPFPVSTKCLVYTVITILTTKEIETCTALIGIYQKLKELKLKSRLIKNDDDMLAYAVAGIVKRIVIMKEDRLRSTFTTGLLKVATKQKEQEEKDGVFMEESEFTSASFIDFLMAIQNVMFPTLSFDGMISSFQSSDTPDPSSPPANNQPPDASPASSAPSAQPSDGNPTQPADTPKTVKTSWFNNLFKGGRKSVKQRGSKRMKQRNRPRSKRRKLSKRRTR
jgi:hypothetical protein